MPVSEWELLALSQSEEINCCLCIAAAGVSIVAVLLAVLVYRQHYHSLSSAFNDVYIGVVVVQVLQNIGLLSIAVLVLSQQRFTAWSCNVSGSLFLFFDGITQVFIIGFYVIVGNTRLVTSLEYAGTLPTTAADAYITGNADSSVRSDHLRDSGDHIRVVDEEGGNKRYIYSPSQPQQHQLPQVLQQQQQQQQQQQSHAGPGASDEQEGGRKGSQREDSAPGTQTWDGYSERSDLFSRSSMRGAIRSKTPAAGEPYLQSHESRTSSMLSETNGWCCCCRTRKRPKQPHNPLYPEYYADEGAKSCCGGCWRAVCNTCTVETGERLTFARVTLKIYIIAILYGAGLLGVVWLVSYNLRLTPFQNDFPHLYFTPEFAWCSLAKPWEVPHLVDSNGQLYAAGDFNLISNGILADSTNASSSSSDDRPLFPSVVVNGSLIALRIISSYLGPLVAVLAALYAYRSLRKCSPSLFNDHHVIIIIRLFAFCTLPLIVSGISTVNHFALTRLEVWSSPPSLDGSKSEQYTGAVVSFLYPFEAVLNVVVLLYTERAWCTMRRSGNAVCRSTGHSGGCCAGLCEEVESEEEEYATNSNEQTASECASGDNGSRSGEPYRTYRGGRRGNRAGAAGYDADDAGFSGDDDDGQIVYATSNGFCGIVKAIACTTVLGVTTGQSLVVPFLSYDESTAGGGAGTSTASSSTYGSALGVGSGSRARGRGY